MQLKEMQGKEAHVKEEAPVEEEVMDDGRWLEIPVDDCRAATDKVQVETPLEVVEAPEEEEDEEAEERVMAKEL